MLSWAFTTNSFKAVQTLQDLGYLCSLIVGCVTIFPQCLVACIAASFPRYVGEMLLESLCTPEMHHTDRARGSRQQVMFHGENIMGFTPVCGQPLCCSENPSACAMEVRIPSKQAEEGRVKNHIMLFQCAKELTVPVMYLLHHGFLHQMLFDCFFNNCLPTRRSCCQYSIASVRSLVHCSGTLSGRTARIHCKSANRRSTTNWAVPGTQCEGRAEQMQVHIGKVCGQIAVDLEPI